MEALKHQLSARRRISDMARGKSVSIEENFDKLEEIIERLESSELPLEEAFKLYESGVKLTAQCTQQLDKVEKQLIILRNEADSPDLDGDED